MKTRMWMSLMMLLACLAICGTVQAQSVSPRQLIIWNSSDSDVTFDMRITPNDPWMPYTLAGQQTQVYSLGDYPYLCVRIETTYQDPLKGHGQIKGRGPMIVEAQLGGGAKYQIVWNKLNRRWEFEQMPDSGQKYFWPTLTNGALLSF